MTALWTSVKAGLGATAIALVLGSMVAFAVARYRFFGREAVSFLVILPIALPGVITGIALNNAFRPSSARSADTSGCGTVIVGHATFCIVVVYNNVLARLRRTGASLEEASADLGAGRSRPSGWSRCRRSGPRCFAGGLLAFALSLRRDHRDDVHRRARACRRCRSGSSATCSGRTRRRSSTWSRPAWSSCRSCRSGWPSASAAASRPAAGSERRAARRDAQLGAAGPASWDPVATRAPVLSQTSQVSSVKPGARRPRP